MDKTLTIKAVKGLRNNTDPERFDLGDLARARNVDIDSSGRLSRRKGYDLLSEGEMHSLWANGESCFVVNTGELYRVQADFTLEPLYFSFIGPRVTYAGVDQTTFFSDEYVTGSVRTDGRVRAWGMQTPDTPHATRTAGDLPAGTYMYAMTFVRDDGFESGASRARATTLNEAGGLSWAELPMHSEATKVRIYLSQANSELLYHAGDFAADGSAAVIRGILHRGVRLRSQFLDAPPPGRIFGPWMGRIYIANGHFISFTQPFEYELVAPRQNWWAFNDKVLTMAFVDDGIYVGTTQRTYFVQGGDPTTVTMREVLPYGTVMGTEVVVRPDLVGEGITGQRACYWMSSKGVCLGLPGGQVVNLTGERYEPSEALYGAGVFIDRNGLPQYRVSLFDYQAAMETPAESGEEQML